MVPFLNLKAMHDPLKAEFMAVISEVVDSNAFAGGPYVQAFEEDFAPFCQCQHAIGVGNGTDALWLSLLAMDIGPGDEVITTPNTFIATAEAISFAGATPVFVDIDEQSHNIDPNLIEAAITDNTKAIIPVHLFGQMADMDPIMAVARKHGLKVIEDASQAHGAEYKGRRAGSIGDTGCFSFYPGKNLGAFGEAGAVVTNNADLATRIRMLRDHGQEKKYHHKYVGWNGRMDGIQGAVLKIKLAHLPKANEARRAHAAYYTEKLQDVDGLITPAEMPGHRHIYHIYAVRMKERNAFIESMKDKGVACAIHYPIPIHLQEAYRSAGIKKGAFPVAEQCAAEYVSLPMFPDLTRAQLDAVVEATRECLGSVKLQALS